MMNEDYAGPGASPSSVPHHDPNDMMASNTGSSFQQPENEGLAEAGAAVTVDMITSITDVTLEQALLKLREIDGENALFKDQLINNSQQMKRQYEALTVMKIKNTEKVDQFKALISSLREDVKELQIKVMAQEDKEKQNVERITTLENENALLQRQKSVSEQRVINVMSHAKTHGLDGLDDMESLPDMSDAVYVATEDKEKEIETLEASLAAKGEIITSLRNDLLTVNFQRDQYKMSNEVLFKDMEGLQKQKGQLDRERRQLHEQNCRLNKELDQQMQSNIASTKKEIEGQKQVVEEKKVQSLDVSDFLNDAENLEEMFGQKLHLQEHQNEIERLKAEMEEERTERLDLEEKLRVSSNELDDVKNQHALAREKMELLEKEKAKMLLEFEENLSSITHQRQENEKIQQAKVSEDQCALRSQVISLLNDVDELNTKLSLASMEVQQKDRRINELTQVNSDWRVQFDEQWHHSSSMIQTLQTQLSQQESVSRQRNEEHNGTTQQYQSLQDNFNRLVTDYKELLEMFENDRSKAQQQGVPKEVMEEMDKRAAQVIAAEEAINYRDKQLEEYKIKNSDLDENIKLLHFQLETYQTDFQTERESRTKMAQEKSALEEDFKRSQEQIKVLTEQQNKRQMEDIQRRVNQTQRPPTYTDAQRLYDFQHSTNPPSSQQQLQQQQMESYQQMHSGMPSPHTLNYSSNRYRPPNQSGLPMHGYGPPSHLGGAAAGPAAFDDPTADQFPSLAYECPKCGMTLPDTDTLQLHVSDCLDRPPQS